MTFDYRVTSRLTFDFGYANNHQYVLSLLEKYHLPATFFITAVRDAGYDILWNNFPAIIDKYGPSGLLLNSRIFVKGQFNRYISENRTSLTAMLRSDGFNV